MALMLQQNQAAKHTVLAGLMEVQQMRSEASAPQAAQIGHCNPNTVSSRILFLYQTPGIVCQL